MSIWHSIKHIVKGHDDDDDSDGVSELMQYVAAQFVYVRASQAGLLKQLRFIRQELNKIMATQEEFDAKITTANEALDSIGAAVTAEAKQVADFIAAQPKSVDTSALDGVVTRLGGVATSVSDVFTPSA